MVSLPSDKRIVLVTGASRGIGAATAFLLGQRGFFVCINYLRNCEHAEFIANSIIANGGKATTIQCDIGKEKEIQRMFDHIGNNIGYVTALVNNAGFCGSFSKCEDVDYQELTQIFSINVFGVFMSIKAAIMHMKKVKHGSIVNISSESAKYGGSNLVHYAASKAAINSATVGLARELAPYNIRVNAVSPGVIDTDLHKDISEERRRTLQKSLPFGRMGKPHEVAETIAWLLSEQSSYVSGSIISVTGAR